MKKLEPKLRFPEFEGNWEKKRISDILKIGSGRDYKHLEKGKIPVYGTGGLMTYVDDFLYDGDSVCIGRKGTIDKPRFLEGKFWTVDTLFYTHSFNNSFPKFIFSIFNRINWNLYNEASGVPSLSKSTIEKIEINIPNLEEQQKIASFLTSVDERITLLEKQKQGLVTYKRGVMQQLFSQQLRFKDDKGKDFPDWEEKKLGDIGYFQTSSIDKLTKDDEKNVFLVNYMNVYRHENINNETIKSFQIVTAKDSQIESCSLKKGDILFTPSSETPDDIGHSVVIFEDLENTVFSYHLMRFRPIIDINILYSHYFCNVPDVLNQLTKYSTGSTRFTISVGNFSKVKIKLPCLQEQQKIASFLSAIDARIEVVSKQIEQSKVFKKGLLQQMFV